MSGAVVVLAGGTGGAKLARGMLDVVGPERLVVIANTADDIEIYGGYVSPDVDLVTFWLADRIDPRGWGLDGDTFNAMDGLRELGVEVWFSLGDRDLALALMRAQALAQGARPTEVQQSLRRALGVGASVLPVSDQPVRTRVMVRDRWVSVQEFLIRCHSQDGWEQVRGVEFRGAATAQASNEVLEAIAGAETVVIGPSNPIISIGPMLAIEGVRAAIADCPAPVVAVSPIVKRAVLKGPTAEFMRWRGLPPDASGIAGFYDGLIDGLVSDEAVDTVPTLQTDVAMVQAAGRRRLAEEALRFGAGLREANRGNG
jgi:LPPG:FO 2-phospho-L-lactate transferase